MRGQVLGLGDGTGERAGERSPQAVGTGSVTFSETLRAHSMSSFLV